MEKGEGEESFVAFLGKELLFKLHKVSLQMDHLGCSAIGPGHKMKQVGCLASIPNTIVPITY
jgi:hypothetical protein